MHRALKFSILYCSFLSSILLCSAHVDQLPADLYQEIVVNADTLADSAALFSKLSQTSKLMKQQLEKAFPALVEQLAQKYGVEKELVAFYFGIERVKQLFPSVLKDQKRLSQLLETLIVFEKRPKALQKMLALLIDQGATFGRTVLGLTFREYDNTTLILGRVDLSQKKGDNRSKVSAFEQSSLKDLIDVLRDEGAGFTDFRRYSSQGNTRYRFLIESAFDMTIGYDNKFLPYQCMLVDTDDQFNIIPGSERDVFLDRSLLEKYSLSKLKFGTLFTSADGQRDAILLSNYSGYALLMFDGDSPVVKQIVTWKNNKRNVAVYVVD